MKDSEQDSGLPLHPRQQCNTFIYFIYEMVCTVHGGKGHSAHSKQVIQLAWNVTFFVGLATGLPCSRLII